MTAAEHIHEDSHDEAPRGFLRWLYSTNHKDIGTMYLIFSVIAGLIGGGISMYMRMELQDPGVQYMENGFLTKRSMKNFFMSKKLLVLMMELLTWCFHHTN